MSSLFPMAIRWSLPNNPKPMVWAGFTGAVRGGRPVLTMFERGSETSVRVILATLGLAGTGLAAAPAAAGGVGLTAHEEDDDLAFAPRPLRLLTDLDAEVVREAEHDARLDAPRLRLTTDLEAEVAAESARAAPLSRAWLERALGGEDHVDLVRTGGEPLSLAASLQTESESAAGAMGTGISDWSLTASISGVSDYRFRGVSQSDRNPAVQGSIEVSHSSGLYAGVWGSSIARYAGTNVELDLYAGWRGTSSGGLGLDLGVNGYVYPGGHSANYVELTGRASYTLGPVEIAAGANYAPSQRNIGGSDNLYLYAETSIGVPNTPVTITAHAGREEGSLSWPLDPKWDWSLGTEIVLDRFSLGLSYVDTDANRLLDPDRQARPGVVATLSFEF